MNLTGGPGSARSHLGTVASRHSQHRHAALHSPRMSGRCVCSQGGGDEVSRVPCECAQTNCVARRHDRSHRAMANGLHVRGRRSSHLSERGVPAAALGRQRRHMGNGGRGRCCLADLPRPAETAPTGQGCVILTGRSTRAHRHARSAVGPVRMPAGTTRASSAGCRKSWRGGLLGRRRRAEPLRDQPNRQDHELEQSTGDK